MNFTRHEIQQIVTSNLSAFVAIHLAVTTISVAFGTYAGTIEEDDPNLAENTVLAKSFEPLTSLITSMYSGNGANGITGVRLCKKCTFEDPAVICSGSSEIIEAFRALRVTEPEVLSPPRIVDVDPDMHLIQVKYFIYQKYFGRLVVKSFLLVDAELTGDELLISKIEERWNGVSPLGLLYYPSRRLNGILSYNLTKMLVK